MFKRAYFPMEDEDVTKLRYLKLYEVKLKDLYLLKIYRKHVYEQHLNAGCKYVFFTKDALSEDMRISSIEIPKITAFLTLHFEKEVFHPFYHLTKVQLYEFGLNVNWVLSQYTRSDNQGGDYLDGGLDELPIFMQWFEGAWFPTSDVSRLNPSCDSISFTMRCPMNLPSVSHWKMLCYSKWRDVVFVIVFFIFLYFIFK